MDPSRNIIPLPPLQQGHAPMNFNAFGSSQQNRRTDDRLPPSLIPLGNLLEIEPIKYQCNTTGSHGWLRKIGDVPGLVVKVRLPGYTATNIADQYRARVRFSTLPSNPHPGWGHVTPWAEDVPMPDTGTIKVPYGAVLGHGPCTCPQDHRSILYNVYKQPIGLLGGLSFLPKRLEPAGWSCCAHFGERTPMPLHPWEMARGCLSCLGHPPPVRSRPDVHVHTGGHLPCRNCFLVNCWAEPLVLMDTRRYDTTPFLNGTSVLLPHEFPSHYPQRSPLAAHLEHRTYLRARGTHRLVKLAIRRLFIPEAQTRLDQMLTGPPEALVKDLIRAIKETESAWAAGPIGELN